MIKAGYILAAAAATLLPSNVSAGHYRPGSEFNGHVLKVERTDGTFLMHHMSDGSVTVSRSGAPDVEGHWHYAERHICYDGPKGRKECWSYGGRLKLGKTVASKAKDGRSAKITLLRG